MDITDEKIKKNYDEFKKDMKYGPEDDIIRDALTKFPKNKDKSVVAMKISLIDLTNGTNLLRNLGTEGGLNKLAEQITKVDFDERVKKGDLKLVNELGRWTKENIGKNLFSFISKYCVYHNYHCYGRDDYVIYDSIMCENLHEYITRDEYKDETGKKLYKNTFLKLKDSINYNNKNSYEEYVDIIDYIANKNSLSKENRHRKLELFIWYPVIRERKKKR